MPICPGCEQKVAYQKLDTHQRYCEAIWNDRNVKRRSWEQLEAKLTELEKRFEARLQEVDRRVRKIEERNERQVRTPSRK